MRLIRAGNAANQIVKIGPGPAEQALALFLSSYSRDRGGVSELTIIGEHNRAASFVKKCGQPIICRVGGRSSKYRKCAMKMKDFDPATSFGAAVAAHYDDD